MEVQKIQINEHGENLNISDVRGSKMIYTVIHS